jgi:glycosyltransferase involved in cell wall biosynthesis
MPEDMTEPTISFIIGSLNEGDNLKKTIRSLQANTNENYEIIVVDDGSTDSSSQFIDNELNDPRIHLYKIERLGSANSKNFGAQRAQGGVLCFLDAHVLFMNDWFKPLLQQLDRQEVGIVAPALSPWQNHSVKGYGMRWRNCRLDMVWLPQRSSLPYPVPMVGLACMAMSRQYFDKIGGFDPGLRSYGSTDQEICLRTWLCGYVVAMVPQVAVSHLFRKKFPYPVQWSNSVYNRLRMIGVHFNFARMQKCTDALRSLPGFQQAFQLLKQSNIEARRQHFLKIRKYDDDWFFEKFDMNI